MKAAGSSSYATVSQAAKPTSINGLYIYQLLYKHQLDYIAVFRLSLPSLQGNKVPAGQWDLESYIRVLVQPRIGFTRLGALCSKGETADRGACVWACPSC